MSKLNRKDDNVSIKALWRMFYDEERELFALFDGHNPEIDIKHFVDGYFPKYQERVSGNKTLCYPPKNIRIIAEVSFEVRKAIMSNLVNMKEYYKAAWEAKNGTFTPTQKQKTFPYPHRFPQFVDNASEIIISQYPAYRSQRIKNEPFRIATRAINSDTITGPPKNLFSHIVLGFEKHGIKTHEKDGELFIDGGDLLRVNKAKSIQVREESGVSYRLRINYPHESKQERRHYGFILINNDVQITEADQVNDPSRTIESKARSIDYDFLPDGMKMFVTLEH